MAPTYGSRQAAQANAPGADQIPKALADMIAAALRGGTKATLGLPGDIEGLGRLGINKLAGEGTVSPESALPNTEDWGKRLPPLSPLGDMGSLKEHPMERVGEFAPLPGIPEAAIQAARLAKGLRSTSQAAPAIQAVDQSRRGFMKNAGALGAGAAAATMAPNLIVKALKAAPTGEIAPAAHMAAAEGGLARAASPEAAKMAAKAWSKEAVAAALGKHMEALAPDIPADQLAKYLTPQRMKELEKHYGSVENLENVQKWGEHWEEPNVPRVDWNEVHEIAKKSPNYEQMHPSYGLEGAEKAAAMKKATRGTPEQVKAEKAYDYLNTLSDAELDKIEKMGPDRMPAKLKEMGVTPELMSYRLSPIYGTRGGPTREGGKAIWGIMDDAFEQMSNKGQ